VAFSAIIKTTLAPTTNNTFTTTSTNIKPLDGSSINNTLTRDQLFLAFIKNHFGIHAPFVFTYCIVISSILIGIFITVFVCVEFVRYRDIESDLDNFVSEKSYL